MPIIVSEPSGERGRKDARRHREKHREAAKEKLPELIANESIITQKKGKTYKIPIKIMEIPHFRPIRGEIPEGLGQGAGEPGDVIDHRPGNVQPGAPGQEPGKDYLEAEFELDEIIDLMLEDLGLPELKEKDLKTFTVEIGWKITGITRSGPWSLLDRRATAKEGMKRFWQFLKFLQSETQKDELVCFLALKQAQGIAKEALELLRDESLIILEADKVEPFPIFANDDLRFKEIKEENKEESNAVIIAMMDVSGSMGDMKKYLARAMIFWLKEFLTRHYTKLIIRFIIHHSTARIVSEEDFFRTGESGGTMCYAAYELARNLIETEYPVERWNVYVWHFSDGEDSDSKRTAEELEKIIKMKVNMVGYGEIKPGSQNHGWFQMDSGIWKTFQNHFGLKESDFNGVAMMIGDKNLPLLCVRIEEREHILPSLKIFLKKDRWAL
ncbi:MAG: DUF444 family protein [bacterium]|nr:DUF444 family protein [bacterium]